MKKTVLTASLVLIPGLLAAQQQPSTSSTQAKTKTTAQAKPASTGAEAKADAQLTIPTSFSAESRAKLEAVTKSVREKQLPEQPLQQRLAEGQAKGAAEAEIVAAVGDVAARLETAQSALVRAGRAQPQPAEVASAAQAMERGATDAQIEALAKHSASDRSLTVSFDVLAKLAASGVSVDDALSRIQAKLDAKASDEVIASLAGSANAPGKPDGPESAPAAPAAGAAVNAAAGASAAVGGVGKAAAGVTGTVKGAVVPKKP